VSSDLLDRQRRSFDNLVETGVYDLAFDHSAEAKSFVGQVLRYVVPRLDSQGRLSILDCGCGTGAWLAYLHEQFAGIGVTQTRLCGFDLSERMVALAHTRLNAQAEHSDIRSGNVLDRRSYAFGGLEGGFDLIFTYDVVQQLPRARQFDACRTIVNALAPGGMALIFDNDAESSFGRRMALRKFLTRYGRLPLVPDYYCNAAYPRLQRLRRRMEREERLRAEIVVRDDGIKRCMVVGRDSGAPKAAGFP
jgi:SAM-dependent methyltransferase